MRRPKTVEEWITLLMYAMAVIIYIVVAFQLAKKLLGGSWATENILIVAVMGLAAQGFTSQRMLSRLDGKFEQFEKRFEEHLAKRKHYFLSAALISDCSLPS